MIVLIPAYEPGSSLPELTRRLPWRVVVVDDGSKRGDHLPGDATVLRHAVNRGKGAALKTGFRYIAEHFPGQAVVCADADGQHRPDDVRRVAAAIRHRPVLGVRTFDGPVPLRSRIGNDATRWLFAALTGTDVADTQTGLRGFPPAMLPWLMRVPGERYEYEMSVLASAVRAGYRFDQVPISTVYEHGNASSHFRPVRDSLRIYAALGRRGKNSRVTARSQPGTAE